MSAKFQDKGQCFNQDTNVQIINEKIRKCNYTKIKNYKENENISPDCAKLFVSTQKINIYNKDMLWIQFKIFVNICCGYLWIHV